MFWKPNNARDKTPVSFVKTIALYLSSKENLGELFSNLEASASQLEEKVENGELPKIPVSKTKNGYYKVQNRVGDKLAVTYNYLQVLFVPVRVVGGDGGGETNSISVRQLLEQRDYFVPEEVAEDEPDDWEEDEDPPEDR